ncbi:MAG: hypothetical protein IKV52_05140 [Oscillospiraceae bacterium]|nr:hypothetical protein [Oscillospiraceae bacterium]
MIIVNNIKLNIDTPNHQAVEQAVKRLKLSKRDIASAFIHKMSVDARGDIKFVYSVGVELADKTREAAFAGKNRDITVKQSQPLVVETGTKTMEHPPVVCGLGPAGLFCALVLARQGFRPIVLEQGQDVDSRTRTVERFSKEGILDTQSNVQFGEGGAGTFSDGKLTTRIGDARCEFVTDTLVEFGAPEDIKHIAKPHIGTDLLVGVIKNIRNEIIRLGGQVHFGTKLTSVNVKNGRLVSVDTDKGTIATQAVVMATGHSARDTFFMLRDRGLDMEAKPFSVGVRIESLQSDIDKGLYHSLAGHPALPKGEYQLSHHTKTRGVYTFCMCPGGSVVAAASEEDTVVVNGMSYHARDGRNANSAMVVSVLPEDFGGDFAKAVAFQRELEHKAFVMGGRNYKAPAQTVDNFLQDRAGLNIKKVTPTYPLGVTECNMAQLFPQHITDCLREAMPVMNRKLNGFAAPDSVITGVETRTSSPVRILRGENFQSNVGGVYPCGEGAGYAGGIMSAAVDGVRVAQQLCSEYRTAQ